MFRLTHHYLRHIFEFQIGFILYLLFSIFSHRLVYRFVQVNRLKVRKKILDELINLSSLKRPIPNEFYNYLSKHKKQTLFALEDLKKNNKSIHVDEYAKPIIERVLKGFALRSSRSIFWKNRNYAVRIFSYLDESSFEKELLGLFEDSQILNQTIAATALIKIKSPSGINKIITKMMQSPKFGEFYYRYLFSEAPDASLEIVSKLAEKSSSQDFQICCMKVHAAKKSSFQFEFLSHVIFYRSDEAKMAFLKLLKVNRPKEMEELLLKFAQDSNLTISKEAIDLLGGFSSHKTLTLLKEFSTSKNRVISQSANASLAQTIEGAKFLRSLKDPKIDHLIEFYQSIKTK